MLLLLTLTASCSGGGGVSTPTGVILVLDWPDATRVLPVAAKSVQVRIKNGAKVLAEKLYLAGPDAEEQINDLPFATALVLEASAYATTDGTGAPLATAAIPFNLFKGKQERLAVTLASVITRIELGQSTTDGTINLTAVGRDSAGSAVLTLPAQWQWSQSTPHLGTLTPAGASATFIETGFGIATLTASEKESGKSTSITRPVCVGDPSTVPPTVGSFTSPNPIETMPLPEGRFVLLHGTTLASIDGTGAIVWQRSIPYSDGSLVRRVLGGYIAVVSKASSQFRMHRLSDGSFFWEGPKPLQIGSAIADSTSRVFAFDTSTEPPVLQAREVNTGVIVWSRSLPRVDLLWADSTRLLAYNSTDAAYFLLHAGLGHSLWESRVVSGSKFMGIRLSGTSPLIFSLAPGELRALFLGNGVRLWTVATTGDAGYVTPDEKYLLTYSPTACAAYDPATGAQLWSRSGLIQVVGMLPNGDLLVLPPAEIPGCQPIQALRPTDGRPRWSTYLPSTKVAKDSFMARIAGTRLYVSLTGAGGQGTRPLFAMDSATGIYLWGTREYGPSAGTAPLLASGAALALPITGENRLTLLRDSTG